MSLVNFSLQLPAVLHILSHCLAHRVPGLSHQQRPFCLTALRTFSRFSLHFLPRHIQPWKERSIASVVSAFPSVVEVFRRGGRASMDAVALLWDVVFQGGIVLCS